MQRINAAYLISDIAELLEIQEEYANYEGLPDDIEVAEEAQVSFIDKEIERVKKEIDFIKSQKERVKTENQMLKSSELGLMHKEWKQAKKHGHDMVQGMVEELEEMESGLMQLKELLTEFLETGKFPEEKMMEMMGTSMFMNDDDIFDISGMWEDDEDMDLDDISPDDLLQAMFGMMEQMEQMEQEEKKEEPTTQTTTKKRRKRKKKK